MVFVGFSAELICILKVGDFKGPIPFVRSACASRADDDIVKPPSSEMKSEAKLQEDAEVSSN